MEDKRKKQPKNAAAAEDGRKTAADHTASADSEKKEAGVPAASKRWFGRGVYGSKDVPIRLLDGFILLAIVVIVALVFWFATHGGYTVTFETDGGTEISTVKLRHGELVPEPEIPVKPGYTLNGWVTSLDETEAQQWNFQEDVVETDLTLYAVWTPAQITVKFDLDGGTLDGSREAPEWQVTYGEPYGTLPVPEKEGFTFNGWIYSGEVITEETTVTMNGEHVLTASWRE